MIPSSDLKIRKKNLVPLFTYALSVAALFIFLVGFFPVKYSSRFGENSYTGGSKNIQKRYVDKLVFIVIDALRYDFVMPGGNEKYMPFTQTSILEGEACYMLTKAHSPTVTLPRIKAITSGTVSSYIDVILNFMSNAFEEENFISTAVSRGLTLVFYGDETWLKLFPNSFTRSEGTHSFFTYDYYEVDSNVTRHIYDEFKRDDWDIIILHYLGLDHIGHTEGPQSPYIMPKLFEMDSVIKRFNQHLKELEANRGLKTMLLVTGDHGMKDSGSHGGVTHHEVTVPLISVGKPCSVLPGWPAENIPLQIDLAPTLSTLFGLPIPFNSRGKLIPELFHNVSREEMLKHLETNRVELSKFGTVENTGSEMSIKLEKWLLDENRIEEIGQNIANRYFQTLTGISQELVESNSDFKLFYLISSAVLLWVILFVLLLQFYKQCPWPQRCIHWFLVAGTILHATSLISSSFIEEEHQTWYFLWATFCLFLVTEGLNLARQKLNFSKMKNLLPWVLVAIMHRVLRKLNQTGDKWALLPDIKCYLHSDEGQYLLAFVFLAGIGMVFWCAVLEKCPLSQLLTYGISLLSVIAYRFATANIKLLFLTYPSSRGLSEIVVFWIFFTIFTVQTAYNRTQFYLIWLAFASLLLRPHNVILLPMQVFMSRKLYKVFHKTEDNIWNNLAHIWLGHVFYFYQGNGNSLSNVDVAAGFVGVETYNPIYAGTMIAAHTFNGHILSFILSPKSDLPFILLRVIPLTVYCTVVMFLLHHLFIWSVFSPKLLYDSCTTILLLLLLSFNHLSDFLKSAVR